MGMSQAPTEPITLNATEVNAASQLLGRAFQDDPLMVYLVPDAEKLRRLLPSLFCVVTCYCLRYGAVYTTPGLDGLACCLPPDQHRNVIRLMLIGLCAIPRCNLAWLPCGFFCTPLNTPTKRTNEPRPERTGTSGCWA